MAHRVSLEIDIRKLKKNFNALLQRVSPAEVMAVVKANAYGLGVKKIAPVLKDAGAKYFAVATVDEAEEIKDYGLPIQILGNVFDNEIADAVKMDLIIPAADFANACQINQEAAEQNKKIRIAIPVDTGMGRIGQLPSDALNTIIKIKNELENVEFFGIYSHLSTAWKLEDDYTFNQIEKLENLLTELQKKNIYPPHIYIAASNGISNYQKSFRQPFNIVRCGINMYGFTETQEDLQLEEVARFTAKLIAVRELPAGSSIGYNRMHTLKKASKVGTIAAGYADGIPLALSNCGRVLVCGKSVPIIGRISMDYTTILLDDAPEAAIGDEVVLFGRQQDAFIPVDEWANAKKTHPHELFCAIGSRVKRVYLNTECSND